MVDLVWAEPLPCSMIRPRYVPAPNPILVPPLPGSASCADGSILSRVGVTWSATL